jgi:hypothetical protein
MVLPNGTDWRAFVGFVLMVAGVVAGLVYLLAHC